jgi:hypothetical protein
MQIAVTVPTKATYNTLYIYFFGGLYCVCHSFANVAHFVFLGDVWIRTQRAAVASRRATNLATQLATATHLSTTIHVV